MTPHTKTVGVAAPHAARSLPAEAEPLQDAQDETLLLARLRAQDEDAFAEMITRYGPRLLAAARRMLSSEEDAQDVLQEAFLSAFRALDTYKGEARLSTWLQRIVINAALMRRRSLRNRREEDVESLLPEFNSAGQFAVPPSCWADAADVGAELQDTRAMVRRCIDLLPEGYRIALLLRDIEEMETAEVARHLGVSVNAVKVRVHRARQALRTLLDRHLGMIEA